MPFRLNVTMMTSSNGNIFRVTGPLCGEFTGPGEFPAQRPVTRRFDVFFDLRPNKRLSKQPWGWRFETLSWSLWRHHNDYYCYISCTTKHLKILHSRIIRHPLSWRHDERDGVSNHQPNDCLLNRLFRLRSKKTSKLRVTGLCEGNSPVLRPSYLHNGVSYTGKMPPLYWIRAKVPLAHIGPHIAQFWFILIFTRHEISKQNRVQHLVRSC